MKKTTVKIGRITIGMGAPPLDGSRAAADLARRVSVQIARRSGVSVPPAIADRIAGPLARALSGRRSR